MPISYKVLNLGKYTSPKTDAIAALIFLLLLNSCGTDSSELKVRIDRP